MDVQSALQDYLRENMSSATMVDPASMSSFDVPLLWVPIVKATSETRKAETIKVWKEGLGQELNLTIELLDEMVKDVQIIKNDDTYSLVYSVESDDNLYFYEGTTPNAVNFKNEYIKSVVASNSKLKWFYSKLHSGWYFLPTHTLGLLPSNEIFTLNEKEWGILDDIDIDINLSKTVALFHNGSGGYLCLNTENETTRGILWWTDEEPSVDINFWDYLDEWMRIGLEN